MKIELQRTFDEYFKQFEVDEDVNVKLKQLILNNIGLSDELYPILKRFLTIAKEQHYAYSTALGYSMIFYFLYSITVMCSFCDKRAKKNAKTACEYTDEFRFSTGIFFSFSFSPITSKGQQGA